MHAVDGDWRGLRGSRDHVRPHVPGELLCRPTLTVTARAVDLHGAFLSIGRACRTFPALRQVEGIQGLFTRHFEQLTVIIDSDFRASNAQRVPQRNLVRCEHRPAEVFFQRGDHADGAEGIPADEHGLRGGRHVAADPLVNPGWTRTEPVFGWGTSTGGVRWLT
jgi:hypothetical protein